MSRVFADTSFYSSMLNRRDRHYNQANRIWLDLDVRVVTTEYVLLELGSMLRRGPARQKFVEFIRRTEVDETTEVVPAALELFNAGIRLFSERPDKEWSLTDCISFVVMRRRGIVEALTSDSHFTQAGFRVLLES